MGLRPDVIKIFFSYFSSGGRIGTILAIYVPLEYIEQLILKSVHRLERSSYFKFFFFYF